MGNTKILLAAGVFYPDVGGPAIHVMKIAERLKNEGFEPIVLAYGDDSSNKDFGFKIKRISRKYNKILQWALYFFYAFRFSFFSKLVYAFDLTAAGLPACVCAKILRKKFIIRIGGDPIWERVVETGKRFMTLDEYYNKNLYKKDSPITSRTISFVIKRADVIVLYNKYFSNFYIKYFGADLKKIKIVKNPVFKKQKANSELSNHPTLIFAGRFVLYKNLIMVIKAFNNIRKKYIDSRLILVGKGPERKNLENLVSEFGLSDDVEFIESLPQDELFKKFESSSVTIGPALSEFNPNSILESLSLGKPVLLSRGHGLSIDLPEEFLFNPLDQSEFERKVEYLFNPENYKEAVEMVDKLEMNQTWEMVTDFHLDLIKSLI